MKREKTIKRKIRIGELAKYLNVEKIVIHFWEKEFKLDAEHSHTGDRIYKTEQVKKFELIKELLYDKKYTLDDAKKYFEQNIKNDPIIFKAAEASSQSKNEEPKISTEQTSSNDRLTAKIVDLHRKLLKLRELL